MRILDILRTKGHHVVTISEGRSVHEAVLTLVERNIGALVVLEGDRPVGIVTERDVLQLTARSPRSLDAIPVRSIMTRDLFTGTVDSELSEVMDLMTEHRVRHLPVVDGDRLCGIVSIGDVVNAFREHAEAENSRLREYIQGA